MPRHRTFIFAFLNCLFAVATHAQIAATDCKERIATILGNIDRLPPHEETMITTIESRPSGSKRYTLESEKRMVVHRVPPDRSAVTLWRVDEIRLESVSIGGQTWDRWPGKDWQLQPDPKPGSSEAFVEKAANQINAASKAILQTISDPECLGHVSFEGRAALSFRYNLLLSRGELWVEPDGNLPIFEHVKTGFDQMPSRVTVTRRFRYDKSISINPPEANKR